MTTGWRFTNGTIRCTAHAAPRHDGLWIEGARVASGPVSGAATVDLRGACVLPGFTDAHVHFPTWSLGLRQVRLEGLRSLDAVLDAVAAAARDLPPGAWLRGLGWRDAGWPAGEAPSAAALERAAPGVAVALVSRDYHSLWVSSAALTAAGDLPQPPGGVVERDAAGRPTGVLREAAAWAFRDTVSAASPQEHLDAMRDGLRVANARGVVALHDKDGWIDALQLFGRLHAEGALSVRVWQSVPHDRLDALERLGVPPGLGDGRLRVGYVKAFMDGALGSGTAHRLDGSGVQLLDAAGLEAIVRRAAGLGFPVAVHAIGDKANREALDAFERSRDAWAGRGLRHRIEHAQLLHPDDLGRFAGLGVAASVQFSHAPSDRDLADAAWGDVTGRGYAFGSLHRSGALLVNGSDAPVEELDPLAGIAAAVRRSADDRPAWHPSEALDAATALHATCTTPAWLEGAEHRRGRLAPGLAADVVVCDRDPLATPPAELTGVRVLATMVGGEWVHGGPALDG